jgi:eukaryotic-like serine/threonine-protein kinase
MEIPGEAAEELFAEALELPPERRSAFLDKACHGSPQLREVVEQLLRAEQNAGSFLEQPAFAPEGVSEATATVSSSAAARFQPAQLIANRFRVVRFIARGGMGEVYEAKDQFLQGESVALKIIRPEIAADAASSSRFEHEVILARKVVHPNLCPIYEIFHCDQPQPPFLLLTMRLLQGETLQTHLKTASISPAEAVDICRQLLAGVAALHAGGIIHRDLKPNNVILEREGRQLRVFIMDFGLARQHGAETTLLGPGMIAGTPGYMAPEMLRGERPTKATDLFALGVVLHQVLTGEHPIESERGTTLSPSPSLRSAQAPAELVTVIESFLSADPAVRSSAFERFAPGVGSAAQASTFARGPASERSKLWYLGGAAVAVAMLAFSATLLRSPLPAPLESTQLTFSSEPKEPPLFNDGARLYLNSRGAPSQMAVSGGSVVPLHILGPGIFLLDILPDGSRALGMKPDMDDNLGRGTLWTASMLGGAPRKLTDHLALTAQWSPDGHSVVFADQQSLYRIDDDGQNLRKFWDAPGTLVALRFSPDGRELSATLENENGTFHWLWIVSSDGHDAHPLRVDWPENASQSNGLWTPDRRHFIFSSDREGRPNLYEVSPPPWFAFWKKPTAVRITGNQLPILAAAPMLDSKGLFVLGKVDEGAMRAYDPLSKKLVPFLDDLSMLAFVISPDRQWMVYSEYPTRYLWKSRLDGSEKVQLTRSYGLMQQWSPDGKWLAYSDWSNIYLLSADGGTPQKLTPDGRYGVAPSWFPDGKSIAFNYYPYPDQPPRIRVIELATRHITDMPGAEGYYVPSWSPDGKYMVAIAQNPSRMVLYSAETKTWSDLYTFQDPWGYWVWARDSRSLFVGMVQGNNGIYRLSVPQGKWERLTGLEGVNDPQSFDSFMSLTPDGQPAIMSRTGVGQIYSLRWTQ